MKKIATITFHNAINVGAVLQAYALQKTIRNLGYSTEIIDYRNSYIQGKYSIFYTASKSPASIARMLMMVPIRLVRVVRFQKFIRQNLKLSNKIKSAEQFEGLNSTYDTFFVGSDQVWNPYHTGTVDGRYFLDFVADSSKKKSYAASFGLTDLPLEFESQYTNMLKDFSSISVREQSAGSLVEKLSSKGTTLVLDPVYLLDTADWESFSKKPKIASSSYVLLFVVNGLTKDILDTAEQIAKDKSLKIVFLSTRPQIIKGIKVVSNFAPREFLGYVLNASYVITDSFHTMSFSIIFNKDFSLKVASQHGNKNNRSLELMERLGLSERLIGESMNSIDWNSVGAKILLEKERSLDYLRKSIESQ